jgi:hypothetical protein
MEYQSVIYVQIRGVWRKLCGCTLEHPTNLIMFYAVENLVSVWDAPYITDYTYRDISIPVQTALAELNK